MYTFRIKEIVPGDLVRLKFRQAGKLTFMNDDDNQTLLIVFEKNDEGTNLETENKGILYERDSRGNGHTLY